MIRAPATDRWGQVLQTCSKKPTCNLQPPALAPIASAVRPFTCRLSACASGMGRSIASCGPPLTEPLLNALLGALADEGHMPGSAALDAGAAHGDMSCYLSSLVPRAYAVDPDVRNVETIKRRYRRVVTEQRLVPLLGALGARTRSAEAGAPPGIRVAQRRSQMHPYPTHTVDALFSRRSNETLALLHLDVEGFEPEALRGAMHTLRRDAPIVTTEVTVHRWPNTTRRVLETMSAAGFHSFLVEEIAGQRADIRNLLHLPQRRWRDFERSHALTIAIASHALIAVDADSIDQFAYPCCRRGGECCKGRAHCCSHAAVQRFFSRALAHGGDDLQYFSRTTWYDSKWLRVLPDFAPMLRLQRQWRNRSIESAGFSYFRFRKEPSGGYGPS